MITVGRDTLDASSIFIFLFITLGPFTVLRRFATLTRNASPSFRVQLATRTFLIALVATLVSAYAGSFVMVKWHVTVPAIAFTAGVLLFLVAVRGLLELYMPKEQEAPPADPTMALAASPLAFPSIVTPYGLAIAIVLLALAPNNQLEIYGFMTAVIVIDYIVMLLAHPLIKVLLLPLTLIGVVLGVLQVALSLQIIIFAIRQTIKLIQGA